MKRLLTVTVFLTSVLAFAEYPSPTGLNCTGTPPIGERVTLRDINKNSLQLQKSSRSFNLIVQKYFVTLTRTQVMRIYGIVSDVVFTGGGSMTFDLTYNLNLPLAGNSTLNVTTRTFDENIGQPVTLTESFGLSCKLR